MHLNYVAGTTDEETVVRIDRMVQERLARRSLGEGGIVQERLARKAMQNKNQFAFSHNKGAVYVGAGFKPPPKKTNHSQGGFETSPTL